MPAPRPTDSNQLPELRDFLASGAIRRLTDKEREEFVAELFATVRAIEAPRLPEANRPHRLLALYRIGRQLAMMVGLVSYDETLEDGLDTLDESFWTMLHPIIPAGHKAVPLAGAATQMRRAWKQATEKEPAGLSILPPSDYDAREKWCRVATTVARALGMERHHIAIQGTFRMLDVDGAGLCDIEGGELISFEESLIDMIMDLFLDKGERVVKRTLREEYGIGSKEAGGLLRLAKTVARRQTEGSMDEKRAIHERRLESFISRCKETLDMDGEMKALKELAKAQGLTRSAPEDREREFMEALRAVSMRQDTEQLSAKDVLLVQGRMKPTEIEVEDPDDQEALAAFDRENRR